MSGGGPRAAPQSAPVRPAVGVTAQLACLLEVSAPKPGNVSPGRAFADVRYEDFLISAAAIGPAMAGAGTRGVGSTIHAAVEATRARVRGNTNLGIVLLLAPLARAAALGGDLAESLRGVLAGLDVEDAREAYRAIRAAAPGGLGVSAEQDVRDEPTVSLREAMRLAAERDTIAAEYVTGYAVTFGRAAPALRSARLAGLTWPEATVQAYLEVLAAVPDTLIARRLGRAEAEAVSRAAARTLELGGVRTEGGRVAVAELDRELRRSGHARSPGTTADLIAAGLFVVLWESEGRS